MKSRAMRSLLCALGAAACFHLATAGWGLGAAMLGFLFFLLRLTEVESAVTMSHLGLLTGVLVYVPQLFFFWRIFHAPAISLWLIAALWLWSFLMLAWHCRRRYGRTGLALAAPVLWTGCEYFRCEVFWLKFSWLTPGFAFSGTSQLPHLGWLGVYGIGFVLIAGAAAIYLLPWRRGLFLGLGLVAALSVPWPHPAGPVSDQVLHLAGIQLEFPLENGLPAVLDALVRRQPQAEVLVLSEYTLDGPVPESLKSWCRAHKKYLVVGGKDPLPDGNFYDTAFVVGPDGAIVFKQAKCVPVQFFKDGRPATGQRVWESPWGRIGLGICYDASYRTVVDELVRQGAQALIFPTMDVASWGRQQHELNARVGPLRAAEVRLPLFRLASSGISEAVNPDGSVQSSAGFDEDGGMIAAEFRLPAAGRIPFDHWLAPACLVLTAGLLVWLVGCGLAERRKGGAGRSGR